jgi:uncharacterized protein (TIGR00251 family)
MAPGSLLNSRKGTALALRVTPRASKNESVGILSDGTVKVHLTAPPLEGKANRALLKFLAKILDIPVSNITIVAGESSRDKLISVTNMGTEILYKKIVKTIS